MGKLVKKTGDFFVGLEREVGRELDGTRSFCNRDGQAQDQERNRETSI